MSALAKKYEAMSLRERGMVIVALLAVAVMLWDSMLMDPLRRQRASFESELADASQQGLNADNASPDDPRQQNIKRVAELQTQLQSLDTQLTTTAKGFVSSDRMIEVLHDMLDRQGKLELVSIRNLPVTSLIPPADGAEAQAPYVHSIEIVLDGEYADILDYLNSLEKLSWKFRWSGLDLSTAGYPRNRVRIELATLSLDSTWLGV